MEQKVSTFRKLHESGCFAIPNPWDIGSARYLERLGFKAVASTSAGFAFSRGMMDSAVPRDTVLQHLTEIAGAVGIPVNADFEAGYADDAAGVAESVRLCCKTGVAGLSIEDRKRPELYELPEAVDRIRAARAAIDESGTGVMLTARAECYLIPHPDSLRESIRRLQAYAEAGADVLYAPGPTDAGEIRTIIKEVAPKPVNVLMHSNVGLRLGDVAEMGARRVSVGGSLALAAWTGFMRAAKLIAEEGSFAGFDGCVRGAELNALFSKTKRAGE
jgi:2-methylisocitrate lyase-like PEP mutase family enzyme